MHKIKLQKIADELMREPNAVLDSAYREAVILGDAFIRITSDGKIEHLARMIGCCCGEKSPDANVRDKKNETT